MTTTFNGWLVTQRTKKETKSGTSYKLNAHTKILIDIGARLKVVEEKMEGAA